jgi:hypothetical protein
MALPDKVWIVICQNGPIEGSSTPSNCAYELVPSSSFAESAGMTKDQYDELFGAVISIIVTIIIIALIKKAIEQ